MMKSPSIILVLAASAVMVILFAACGATPPDCDLGGPYVFRAPSNKVANFNVYQGMDLFFSKGVLLKENTFKNSVKSDQNNTANGETILKYNYIVSADDCKIYVATWTKSEAVIKDHLNILKKDGNLKCLKIKDLNATSDLMINIWPEDNDNRKRWSPCWLDDSVNKKGGILDAMSKHFILAQKPGSRNIKDMTLDHGDDSAVHRSVAYGGEIVVNLNDCTYTINNGSGTYRPVDHDADLEEGDGPSYLMTMAQKFQGAVGIPPTFVRIWVAEGTPIPSPIPVQYGIQVIKTCDPLNKSASAP